ncbi:UDP-glucose-4-epimerase [Friedmanniomyces endolithicus]|uniref:UDP-glucose 4-epimerase n=1 Tax=Friedmanniomyces endolithicus TaxID=329885 RepID=A0AAN6K445_9PEZI|nr:UDP-glucose-4-epimerase [Friedmanniomyces endolithicus]KAK0276469.1 UDP-glucose-4-epimerase [Friedmanniomyces endolithicus]KAK0277521.1 UDP-glucose-4-epimerase [Friedmanniomyces endolithicus]KAK0311277.1 UDP-glucose-4-epimerase [Friedmanniomyces endolithicus]KAK0319988.1 UDP-glucose-4-epimerase [Friedmanniomyces endolithicus]
MVVGSVLVTGGTGYIGSFTALALLEADYKVVIVDNLYNSSPAVINRIELICGKKPEYIQCDVTDEKKLDEVFEKHPDIDSVVHFAALKAVGESGEIPLEYYRVNVYGTLCLLRSMQRHHVTNIVFSSSATVYGDATRFENMIPIPEECPLGPTNPYGNTKFGVETMITDHINAERANAKKADYKSKDGTAIRDYIHILDLARGHTVALDHLRAAHPGVRAWNLGTGKGSTVYDMIGAFSAAVGRQLPHEVVGRRAGDVLDLTANPTRANRELGWKAERTLEEACEDLWRWTERNPQGYRQEAPREFVEKLKGRK